MEKIEQVKLCVWQVNLYVCDNYDGVCSRGLDKLLLFVIKCEILTNSKYI